MEEAAGSAGERVNRQIAGDDDRDGIEDGTVDIARGGQDDVVKTLFLAGSGGQFAKDVFHHDYGAIDDDAEVDRADR